MLFTHVDARFTIIRRDFLLGSLHKGNSGSGAAETKNISLPSSRQTRVANKKHTNKLHQHLSAEDGEREKMFFASIPFKYG